MIEKTTAKCPRCGMESEGEYETAQLFGWRIQTNKAGERSVIPQSHCKECRRKGALNPGRVGSHLQRRGMLRPGQIGWVHAETCWCMPEEPGRPIWSYGAGQSFRWSHDPDSTFD